MRALVTGGSGFLGSNLIPRLASRFDHVDVVDLVPPATAAFGEFFDGDVRHVLPRLGSFDAVFHLAAFVGGRRGIELSPERVADNQSVDAAFFDYVMRTGPPYAAYLSSSAVYGSGRRGQLFTEDSLMVDGPQRPNTLDAYGRVKLMGERVARRVDCRRTSVVSFRPFTVYGPGQSPDYPIPAICQRAVKGEDPLMVWGSGKQRRDFVYVDDAVDSVTAAFDRAPAGSSVNVCTGLGTDFMTVARLAAEAAGYQPEIRCDADQPVGVVDRVGSPARLHRWHTPRVPLVEGIRRVVESLR
jgi:GDP-L-fucose synthase